MRPFGLFLGHARHCNDQNPSVTLDMHNYDKTDGNSIVSKIMDFILLWRLLAVDADNIYQIRVTCHLRGGRGQMLNRSGYVSRRLMGKVCCDGR